MAFHAIFVSIVVELEKRKGAIAEYEQISLGIYGGPIRLKENFHGIMTPCRQIVWVPGFVQVAPDVDTRIMRTAKAQNTASKTWQFSRMLVPFIAYIVRIGIFATTL
jgi:hypothetical protein